MRRPITLAALLLLAATPALAQKDAPKGDDKSMADSNADRMKAAAEAGYANAPVDEQEVKSHGSVTVDGRALGYAATAGTLTIRDTEGKPTASLFYTAYVLDGVRPGTKRPVTFFYNGGPGSPTFWLRMGSFGPTRLKTANPEFIKPAPYDVGPNPDTLLDKTDMVFIDAVGTGYSRLLGDTKPAAFYGVDEDADAFAKAILRYATKYGRWNSPKFLFGESYGTTRSGAFIASFTDYVTHDLGYKTELPYRLSARDAPGWTWNWAHKSPVRGYGGQQTTPNTAIDLAAAMRANPYLKVLSLNGWYDMATPFFGTETDLGHMMLERAQQPNLSFRYYPAGHMVYLNPEALRQMKRDLAAWYDEAVAEAKSAVPPQGASMSAAGRVPN